ncbi:MAG: hypothetical protein KH135_00935 [Firmicutes bacterium]|nr:hypothetical protein [Bacillota bacterium]
MKQLKNFLYTILGMVLVICVFLYNKPIARFFMENFIYKNDMVIHDANQYRLSLNVNYVKDTNRFSPKNKTELLNIIYTIINNGWDEFTFFCADSYKECFEDTKSLTSNSDMLANFNNFVHPYNSFNRLLIDVNNFGKVHVTVEKMYTEEQIKFINQEIDNIYPTIINDQMTIQQKIKAAHDYIINQTVYDSEGALNIKNKDFQNTKFTHIAYGTFKYHIALCGGYSDAMALFLNKMELPNYKISNEEHVWNLVNIDNQWYHIDLTWDDPVVNTHQNILLDHYFLITGQQILSKDPIHHTFDQTIYQEGL